MKMLRLEKFVFMTTIEPWRWTIGIRLTSNCRDIHLVLPVVTFTLWLPET